MHEDARPIQMLLRHAAIAIAVVCCTCPVWADPAKDDTPQAAAELLASGKHAEAIAAYDALIQSAGQSPPIELRLGRAAALAVLQPGEGEVELRELLASAKRSEVRAAAAFHLGLLEARRAEPGPMAPSGGSIENALSPTPSKTDAETAIKTLKRAERFFRMSGALHAGDGAAAVNVDLVQRRIAAIQEQERERQERERQQQQNKQQSQQGDKSQQSDQPNPSETGDPKPDQQQGDDQESTNKDGSLSDQLKNLADQQQRAADETAKQQPSPDQQDAAQKAAESARKQRDLSEKTREASEKAKSQADASKGEQKREELDKAKQKLDEAQKAQEQAEQQLKDGKKDDAAKSQQQAADALRQAQQHAAADEAAKQQEKDQLQTEQEAKQQQQQAQQPQRPYDATAAQILDRERWLREQLRRVQAQMRSRAAPVEKDW